MTRGIQTRKGKGKSSLDTADSQNRGHTMGQSYFIKESRGQWSWEAVNRKREVQDEAGGR